MAQAAVIEKCDLCEAKENVDFFCVNCDEVLCSGCKVGHAKSKATRSHKIIPLAQARNENIVHQLTVVYCSKHSTIEITLFCLKCDQLICTRCLIGEHNGHNISELDHVRDSKAEELTKLIKILQERKAVYENVFQADGQGHSQFLQSIDQAEKDISAQKYKIIEELEAVCKEQLTELSKLRQDEEKRYSDICKKYQAHNQTVTSTILTAQKNIASKNAALIIQATTDTTNALHSLSNPTMQPTTIASYQPGDRSHLTICGVQGKVNIKYTTATGERGDRCYPAIHEHGVKPKLKEDVQTVKLREQETSDDSKQQQRHDINKPRIRITKVKDNDKDKGDIHVIVPLKNKTAWVKTAGERQLSLMDSKGKIINKSVQLGREIYDAKEYRDGLLVTCWDQCQVTNMSADGKSTSTFSDLSPYKTWGLCVTKDLEIWVCLQSIRNTNNNKVVRLNREGDIIQTIQHDVTGAAVYKFPRRVASLTTGEVIVVDLSKPRRIVGVDSKGLHLFTWMGEIQGKKLHKYSVNNITHDSNNNLFVTDYYNNRVYVLGKDGTGVRCFLDSTHGLDHPQPIALDNDGQVWVGCYDGVIHTIRY